MAPKQKTLIISQDGNLRNQIAAILRRQFMTIEADGGMTGYGKANSGHPDMIIVDTQMECMRWPFDITIEAIRNLPECGDTPIYALVADIDSDDAQLALTCGATQLIPRDLYRTDLERFLKFVMGRVPLAPTEPLADQAETPPVIDESTATKPTTLKRNEEAELEAIMDDWE